MLIAPDEEVALNVLTQQDSLGASMCRIALNRLAEGWSWAEEVVGGEEDKAAYSRANRRRRKKLALARAAL